MNTSFSALLKDVLLILLFSIFMCLYKIDAGSFGAGDQTTHSLVVQEMYKTGNYLHPMYHDAPYYNKPPFKMWLSAALVSLLGESNFSYRAIDGLTGVGICLTIFLFTRAIFVSRLAAYFSVFALLGSSLFFYGHGVRNAVQDSMMLLMMTLGTICGWYLVEAMIKGNDFKLLNKLSLSGGVLVGLAALSKNVAGYFSYVIIAIYVLLSRKTKIVFLHPLKIIYSVLISLSFPLIYILAQGKNSLLAFQMLLITEVYKRAVKGYHNVKNSWFYWDVIVKDRQLVPPELLLIALILAIYFVYKNKDRRYLFLLSWALVPVFVQNLMKSKLQWYILPALPGMAILIGVTLSQSIIYLKNLLLAKKTLSEKIHSLPIAAFAIYGISILGYSNYQIAYQFLYSSRQNAADKISSEIRASASEKHIIPIMALYDCPPLANHELLYFGMQPIVKTTVKHLEELKFLIKNKEVDFVLINKQNADEIIKLGAVSEIRLAKRDRRKRLLVILCFNKDLSPNNFQNLTPIPIA